VETDVEDDVAENSPLELDERELHRECEDEVEMLERGDVDLTEMGK